jgi:hypothetical protein
VQKEDILLELQSLPERVLRAEQDYLKALSYLEESRLALTAKTNELFYQGTIQGKNEQAREAELWPHTHELRRLVLKAKLAAEQAKSELTYVRNKLDNTRLIAQMVLHAPPSAASYDNWAAGPMD